MFLYTGTPRKEARTHVGGQSTEEVLGRQILSMTATNKRVADSGIESASVACTGPVNLKVVPNESCLGRSLWTD